MLKKRPKATNFYGQSYVKRLKEFCRMQLGKLTHRDATNTVLDAEVPAKQARRTKACAQNVLDRDRRAISAEIHALRWAYVRLTADRKDEGITLPIRSAPGGKTGEKSKEDQQKKLRDLEKLVAAQRQTIARLSSESSRVERMSDLVVKETAGNDCAGDWESKRRKLLLVFHPDKLRQCCPNVGEKIAKSMQNHRLWH